MALDIPRLAQGAVQLIWDLIPSALTACTLRDRPASGIYDPETDTSTTTWGATAALSAFLYDTKDKEDQTAGKAETINPMAVKTRKAIVRLSDATDMAQLTTRAELLETVTGFLWNVVDVDSPPGEAIHILTIRR